MAKLVIINRRINEWRPSDRLIYLTYCTYEQRVACQPSGELMFQEAFSCELHTPLRNPI